MSHSKSLGGRSGVTRNPCVKEEESLEIPASYLAHNRRRVRQVVALVGQDVLHAMSTDNPILMISVRSVESKLRSNPPTSTQTNLFVGCRRRSISSNSGCHTTTRTHRYRDSENKDKETHSHRDTPTHQHRHRDTQTQRQTDTETQRYIDTQTQSER